MSAGFLARVAPGITTLANYQRRDFRYDLVATLERAIFPLPDAAAGHPCLREAARNGA